MQRLQQTQLASASNRFGAPSNLQLAKYFLIVSFYRFQGDDKQLTHLLIGESLSHKVEDFQLAWAEWLDQMLVRKPRRGVFALVYLSVTCKEHLPEIVRHPPKSLDF